MAFANNHGVKIYWDEQGSGPPLLLIMGLGCSSDVWRRLRADVAKSYRTIALDNRCSGRSDIARCTIPLMASDVAAVMDAAGVEQAHIVGASMGGMIAQEFALQHPERVHALILACTAPGGLYAVPTKLDLILAMMWRALRSPQVAMDAFIPFLYHPSTPRDRVNAEIAIIKKSARSRFALGSQVLAIFSWGSYGRLPQITAPTLVLHGDSDRLVPLSNGELIARRIPGARLVIIPRTGHMLATDQPEATYKAVSEFLKEVEAMESKETAGPSLRSG